MLGGGDGSDGWSTPSPLYLKDHNWWDQLLVSCVFVCFRLCLALEVWPRRFPGVHKRNSRVGCNVS
eukprot:2756866-Alexandrium_andersonii.AAC.1